MRDSARPGEPVGCSTAWSERRACARAAAKTAYSTGTFVTVPSAAVTVKDEIVPDQSRPEPLE